MDIHLSKDLQAVLGYARDEAMRTGHRGIGTDHLCLGILRHAANGACTLLESLGVDTADLKRLIDARIWNGDIIPYSECEAVRITPEARRTLNLAIYESLRRNETQTRTTHLLLAICRQKGCAAAALLLDAGAGEEKIEEIIDAANAQARQKSGGKRGTPSAEDIADAMEREIKRSALRFRVKSPDLPS